MKKVIVISLLAAVFLVSLALGVWYMTPHSIQIAGSGVSDYRIVTSGDSSCDAAASYLAQQIRLYTDALVPVGADLTDDGAQIVLLVDPNAGSPYSLKLDDRQNLFFSLRDGEHAFETVKAVCDAWLVEGVGLKDGSLRISQSMIQKQLSDLPVALDTNGDLRLLVLTAEASAGSDADALIRLVNELKPDLISTQALSAPWMEFLKQDFSSYYYIMGVNAYDSEADGASWNAVLFRRERFRFVDGDSFWLSDTPYTAGSTLPGAEAPGLCTWVLLRDLVSGQNVYVGNSRLDAGQSAEAEALRERQLSILIDTLRIDSGCFDLEPGFLTGGLFLSSGEPAYQTAVSVCRDAADGGSALPAGDVSLPAACLYAPDHIKILECRQTDTLSCLFVRALPF